MDKQISLFIYFKVFDNTIRIFYLNIIFKCCVFIFFLVMFIEMCN